MAQGIPAADQQVLARARLDALGENQRLSNAGFEEGQQPPLPSWGFWQDGYEVVPDEGRQGTRAIRCVSTDATLQYGGAQRVALNQERPRPIVATGWSRAERVDGSPNSGYAIYLDIEYTDGTNLWGQTANVSTGTHDWEHRRCIVMPQKPIAAVTVYPLFRGHTGTAYFDDFGLAELDDDLYLFEDVPVARKPRSRLPQSAGPVLRQPGLTATVNTGGGLALALALHRTTGEVYAVELNKRVLGQGGPAFFVRDVAADSEFLSPKLWTTTQGGGRIAMAGEATSLGVRLSADLIAHHDHIEIAGRLEDLRGEDRAFTLYFALPIAGEGWVWSDDARTHRPANEGVFINATATGAGATGHRSLYPLAALSGPDAGIALAVPMDAPRHHRLGYDANAGLFFAGFDLGLSPDTAKFPQCATFRLVVYPFDPAWRFRAALAGYYRLFPESFVKRVEQQGLWMAFTDISTVHGWEDFGFAYHEGTNNVPWDERNGILSFIYTEPMTTWLALPEEVARSHDGAVEYLGTCLESPELGKQAVASTTRVSAVRDPDGRYTLGVHDAPWCDGCVFALNADPDLPATTQDARVQGQAELQRIQAAIEKAATPSLPGWRTYGEGYTVDTAIRCQGAQSLRVSRSEPGGAAGASQHIALNQTEPKALVLRASVRAEALTGGPDADCSVYVDLIYADGTPLYGQTLPLEPGNYGFQHLERTIASDKPFKSATVHLLMRGPHTGTLWFDDLFLGEEGADANLLDNAGIEGLPQPCGQIDGTYIDSYQFWAGAINYNRAHFASADIPLVFDAHTHRPGILTLFSTFEFEEGIARRMHDQGKLMMANGVLHGFGFPAHHLDVLGTETNWFREGKWAPMSDAELSFKRAMSFQKPYCFLMNTHYADLTLELTERYMQRALFYGMFPGFFSENAAENCYFQNPDWYEPARPLFKKYVPLIRRIADAGWQPITHARASDEHVYLERYGDPAQGAVYFTAMNETGEKVAATIHIDLDALGWAKAKIAIEDLLGDQPIASSQKDSEASYAVELGPHATHLAEARRVGEVQGDPQTL